MAPSQGPHGPRLKVVLSPAVPFDSPRPPMMMFYAMVMVRLLIINMLWTLHICVLNDTLSSTIANCFPCMSCRRRPVSEAPWADSHQMAHNFVPTRHDSYLLVAAAVAATAVMATIAVTGGRACNHSQPIKECHTQQEQQFGQQHHPRARRQQP